MLSVDANLAQLRHELPPPPPPLHAQAWFKSRHHIGKWLARHKHERNISAFLSAEAERCLYLPEMRWSRAAPGVRQLMGNKCPKNVQIIRAQRLIVGWESCVRRGQKCVPTDAQHRYCRAVTWQRCHHGGREKEADVDAGLDEDLL